MYICFIFTLLFVAAVSVEDETKSTKENVRSPRYLSKHTENRLPSYLAKYYEDAEPYPMFSDKLDKGNSLPYEVPTGFDQFVPDKSSGGKYNYGGFYLPYPVDVQPDRATVDDNSKVTTTAPASYTNAPSKIKDFILKAVKFFTGTSDVDSSEVEVIQPSFLSSIGNIFKDPMVALSAIVIPLGLLLSTIMPFITKLFMGSSAVPSVTSAIAGTVARGLESPEAEKILDAIGEFGARAMRDPRCFQRLLCQTAKAHIEGRSGGFWAAQKIVQNLAKSVDDKLWDALGLNMLFRSLQSGHCDNLQCRSGTDSSPSGLFFDVLQMLLAKLFDTTEVVQ